MEKTIFKKFVLLVFIIAKSLWKSVIEIVWGTAGIILFAGLILQYAPETQSVYTLLKFTKVLLENMIYFWLAIFGLVLNDNIWRLKY